jgi:IPT/TIG domain
MTSSHADAQLPLRVPVWRLLLAAAVASATLGAALCSSLPSERSAMSSASASKSSVDLGAFGLPASARGSISAAIGADQSVYRVTSSDRGFHSLSPPQRLHSRFDRAGVTLRAGATTVQLSLRGAGFGVPAGVAAVAPRAHGNRVAYSRSGLSEWYVNGPLGVEQGFTVARPRSRAASTSLLLALAISGNARASLSPDARTIELRAAGAPALRYGGLRATDASGRALPARLALDGHTIVLRVDTAGVRFPLTVDPLIEGEAPTPDGIVGEGRFGYTVALSANGTTALIGAPGDSEFAGAAWVFTRSGANWTQQGPKLTAPEAAGEEADACAGEAGECGFGRSVALSADGSTALIGAPRANAAHGAAWTFTRAGGAWSQFGERLTAGDSAKGGGSFGATVALSSDGATALVGAPGDATGRGAAWAFSRSATGFAQQGSELTGDGEIGSHFARSLALSADGTTALVGSPGEDAQAGAAWVFARSGADWVAQGAKLTGGAEELGEGNLGSSVALSADGDTALAGARFDAEGAGAVWAFARSDSEWSQQGPKLTATGELGEGQFGSSAALTADGDTALIGAPHDDTSLGAAWTFVKDGGVWEQQSEQTSGPQGGKDGFGRSLALAADGAAALIGAPRAEHRLGAVSSFLGNSPPPVVTSVDPASGSTAGGTLVTITGEGFLEGATVQIGAVATSVQVVSETEITAVTAPGAPGAAEVLVSDANGASTGGASFTYVEPPPPSPEATSDLVSGENAAVPSLGPSPHGSVGVLASTASALPPPRLGRTGNIFRLSGVVRVKLPGSSRFTLLMAGEQIPFGSIVDTRHGKVSVTTARPNGSLQTMIFFAGEFRLTQARNGRATSTLVGGDYASCPTARERRHRVHASAARAKRPVRKLWSEGHGSYSTKGNYATGAVLGTRWLTEDFCGGTLIRVLTDRVAVTNLVSHRHLVVRAGHSYFAKI